jgi:hypothetical protein
MGAQLPLSVKVSSRPLSVIVDAAFALSPLGLLTTMRLAQAGRVWLPRALWTMLDNDALYRQSPQRMGGDWLPAERRKDLLAGMAAELVPWRRAWHYGRLAAQVHWIGDAQYESCLPDRADALLLPRFEACCAAFDARRTERQMKPLSALDDCARDAVALAGALQPEPAVILTLGARDGSEPPLCTFLAAIGIAAQPLRGSQAPLLCELGLAEALLPMAAATEPATALHVLAPGVLSMPEPRTEGDWSLDETDEQGELLRAYAWEGACALWQTVEAP